MITRQNIFTEYPKINQGLLPDALKQVEFEDFKDLFDAYDEDSTIAESVDLFIKQLNAVLSSQKKGTSKKMVSKGRKINLRFKGKKMPKANKEPKAKVKKEPKAKKEKTTKQKREVLSDLPAWLVALRKAIRMENKEYSQTALRNFLTFIHKNFSSSRPGATSTPHIETIRGIQTWLITSINHSLDRKRVKFDISKSLIDAAIKANKSYLVSIDRKSKVSEINLRGINKPNSLSGLQGLGIIQTSELASMDFQTLPFEGKFKELIGSPTKPFQIMIYGLPGSGKSTLAIQLAKYLAENHHFKVLYLAKEEGISGTSQEKFIRLNAIHPNIHIAERMPTDLSFYDVLMIDSVNEMNMSPDDIRAILKQYPKLSTVQLFKATKEGKFLGASDFAHLCQAEFMCYDGKAQTTGKNRFGGNKEIQIIE